MKIRKFITSAACIALSATMAFCGTACAGTPGNTPDATPINTDKYDIPQDYARTYYEVFVRSFSDSDGDGIGDLRGLINNLDYLNDGDDSTTTDLGINGIWLMPIYPTATYHGYDVKDYRDVNPQYGTLDDFDELIEECEKRGIWVQLDLVLNHSSNKHPWFLEAVEDAKAGKLPAESDAMSKYSFMISDSDPSSPTAGTWRKVSGTSNYWYLGNFDTSMPDLNLDNPDVRADIQSTVDFWLERGVRSFRLDAVPYAYGVTESDSGASNIEFWTWFNDYCDQKGREVFGESTPGLDRYCYNVGEVWSSSNVIKDYFATGMTPFNYSMGSRFAVGYPAAVIRADAQNSLAYDLAVQIETEQKNAYASGGDGALISNFLSNHDNDRSASFFAFDAVKIKQAAALYLLAPGNAYIYYGEELGAAGEKLDTSVGDENRRMAFNWGDSSKGVTQNPPGTDYNKSQPFGTWKSQTKDYNSILTFYRNVIKLRNRFPEIARGKMTSLGVDGSGKIGVQSEILAAENAKYLDSVNTLNKYLTMYSLTYGDSTILIVHNLGSASAKFDIASFSGYSLVGELKANGGSIALNGTELSMSGRTTAVLKVVADEE